MSARDDDFARRFPEAARIAVDASLPRPLTGSFSRAPKRTRLAMADLLIASERLTGQTGKDAYAEAGFRSADEYWNDAMAEPMELSKFVHMLAIHFLNPSLEGSGDYYNLDLQDALRFASENGESWFIEVCGGECRLRPREAAEYLLSKPKHEHLVPPGLKAFLENSRNPSAADQTTNLPAKSQRQRKRPKQDPVIESMKSMNEDELRGLSEKEMESRFHVSRDTCRNARQEVLSMKSRSTKTTNDS